MVRRFMWVTVLLAGCATVAFTAAMSMRMLDQPPPAQSPPAVLAVLFVLGVLMVIVAVIGNVALTAIEPHA
jgi:cytochrome c oxidase assembly factor CtaG